eukprot:CAMPEP_0177589682 /NCGR_PEP_ID=MMETSP0419_2-20121207/6953_1 /TAXON_ID=582737 /ORGANISM="Tetraselmis sp., Strain GSL018" /LENGTH=246 /DNA_ID=CAMNT_0019080091 /DNA_START=74 /DNA_END=814 /DNA_ORIENTATION=+
MGCPHCTQNRARAHLFAVSLLVAAAGTFANNRSTEAGGKEPESSGQIGDGEPLDRCWYECVEYGEVKCSGGSVKNPYSGRRLRQFSFNTNFGNPLPEQTQSTGTHQAVDRSAVSFNSRSGTASSLQGKPIDSYTFEEKCKAVNECRLIEGSGVPCGWCQTGTAFGEGFSSTCRKDGVGNCYPREECPGIWTWQFFRCPAINEFGCTQECKYHIKKCINSNFDKRPMDPAGIVEEDFQYFPDWVNGR